MAKAADEKPDNNLRVRERKLKYERLAVAREVRFEFLDIRAE